MNKIDTIGFYGILTNPVVGYEKLAAIMVEAGVTIIQLRMKDSSRNDIFETAKKVKTVIPSHVAYIINDDVEMAKELKSDGVHLGQSDMAYAEARNVLGNGPIIGLSTHNPNQTKAACALNPDYIGVGPVYATPTKKIPDPVLGIEGMQEMLKVATVPAVCLGGNRPFKYR